MFLSASVVLAVLATAQAVVIESLREVPAGWQRIRRASPSAPLHLRIAMSQPNEALFEQTLYDMSNPLHEKYGKHMKRDEIKAMLRPESEATEAVTSWLQQNGVVRVADDGEWINFVTTVANAEALLEARFDVYRDDVFEAEAVRTLQYSLPEGLTQYIDMIQPTTRFSQVRAERAAPFGMEVVGPAGAGVLNATACNTTITPTCIKELYNIRSSKNNSKPGCGFAAFNNFLEEYPRYSDLATFEALYAPYAIGESFTWNSINGGLLTQNDTVEDSGEANLDVQYLLSVGYPVPIHAYSTGGLGPLVPDLDQPIANASQNEPYLDFLTYILAQPDDALPHTLTTSYGEDEQSVPLQYRKTVCNMFGQLGARGVSVLFSSGDTGVGSACQTNDGTNRTAFLPIFPAACPYVTSVGATHYVEPEAAISFSSGGFSNTWARPAYQDAAVEGYLSILGDRWDGLYNRSGRGFPDVAAQGSRFHVIDKGLDKLESGTSASSPTFAGVVALLNSALIEAGRSPLGFLNPWVYSVGYKGLTDIVNGGSTGCTGRDIYSGLPAPRVPYASWNATTGWDPVTGYGTPNYEKLLQIAFHGGRKHGGKPWKA